MTKKDYIRIANAINKAWNIQNTRSIDSEKSIGKSAIIDVIKCLNSELSKDNAYFDSFKFSRACGWE